MKLQIYAIQHLQNVSFFIGPFVIQAVGLELGELSRYSD
jgi:hypothetical protein